MTCSCSCSCSDLKDPQVAHEGKLISRRPGKVKAGAYLTELGPLRAAIRDGLWQREEQVFARFTNVALEPGQLNRSRCI